MRNAMLAVVVLTGFGSPVVAQDGNPNKLKADAAWAEAVYAAGTADDTKYYTDNAKADSAGLYATAYVGDWIANAPHYAKAMTAGDWNSCSVEFKTASAADKSGDTAYASADAAIGDGNVAMLVGDDYYAAGDYTNAAAWYDTARGYYETAEAYFAGAYDFYVLAYVCRLNAAGIMAMYPQ